jgi:hypothetical protein
MAVAGLRVRPADPGSHPGLARALVDFPARPLEESAPSIANCEIRPEDPCQPLFLISKRGVRWHYTNAQLRRAGIGDVYRKPRSLNRAQTRGVSTT